MSLWAKHWDTRPEAMAARHVDDPGKPLDLPHRLVARLGSTYMRGLFGTCLTQVNGFVEHIEIPQSQHKPSLIAFWHCNILLMTGNFMGYPARVLISEHGDGEHIAQVCLRLGFGVVRGSTTRGAARALVQLKRQLEGGHDVVITPDGPRGPARIVQPGLIYLAARSGAPIVPSAAMADSLYEFSSWDRFRTPWPGARIAIRHGTPLYVPPEALQDLEMWQEKVKEQLEIQEQLCEQDLKHPENFKQPRGPWNLVRSGRLDIQS